jgi:signal transduction histidine kinase
MKLYHSLSNFYPVKKHYSTKFLFVAFLGTHIPLLGLIVLLLFTKVNQFDKLTIFLFVLIMTLIATVVTLLILHKLLTPIKLAQMTLRNYLQKNELPDLPIGYTDEVGILLKDMQYTIINLEKILNEKRDLIAMLSHELRNPAATTLGAVTLLKEDIPREEELFYLNQVERSTKKQIELMETILTMLRCEENILKHGLVSLDLKKYVEENVPNFDAAIQNKSLKIEVNIPDDTLINIEPQSFQQVLNNLISNAIKFSFKGSTIYIEAEKKDHLIFLKVKDSGMGFDNTIADRLFDRFTKYSRKGTQNEETHGIGLYLIRKIVEKHNGKIYATSKGENQGAEFIVELPA